MDQFEKIKTIGRGSYGSAILVRARRASLPGDAVANLAAHRLYVIKEIHLSALELDAATTTPTARGEEGQSAQRSRSQAQLGAAGVAGAGAAGSTFSSIASFASAAAAGAAAVVPAPSVSPSLLNEVQILMRVGASGHPNVCRYRGSFLISSDSSPQHAAASVSAALASSSADARPLGSKAGRNDVLCLCLDYYAGGDLSRRIKARVREIARASAAAAGASSTSSSLLSSAASIGGGGAGAGGSIVAPSPSSDPSCAASSSSSSPLCFSESLLLDWLVQLCLGLKHIHDRRILHRDLKTSNVFISCERPRSFHAPAAATRAEGAGREEEQVVEILRIGDFGIARLLDPGGLARTRIGTPYFLSPELATGKHAFQASNLNNLVLAILQGAWSVSLPAAYSPRISLLIQAMLQRRPEHRPTVTQLLSIPFMRERIPHWLSHRRIVQEFGGELSSLPAFQLPGSTTDAVMREARLASTNSSSASRSGSGRHTSSSAPVSPASAHSSASALPSRSVAAVGPPSALRYSSASSSAAIADLARFPSSTASPSASSSAILSRVGLRGESYLHCQPLTPQPPSRGLSARGGGLCAPLLPSDSTPRAASSALLFGAAASAGTSNLRASGLSSSGQSGSHCSSTPSPLPALRSHPLHLAPVPSSNAAPAPAVEPLVTAAPAVDAPAPSQQPPPSVSASSWTLIDRVDRELASLPSAEAAAAAPSASLHPASPEPLVSIPSSDPSFRWHLPSSLAVATGVAAASTVDAASSSRPAPAPAAPAPLPAPSLGLQCERVRAYLEDRIPMHTLKEAYRIMCEKRSREGGTERGEESKPSTESQMLRLLQLSQTHLISLLQQLVEAERAQGGRQGAGHAV